MIKFNFISALLAKPPSPIQEATGWYPIAGGQLELRNTGFVIKLCGKPRCTPYHLVDPDGRPLADSYLLQPLKAHAERCAADRREFDL